MRPTHPEFRKTQGPRIVPPPQGGGGGVGPPTTHPASQPATKAAHKTRALDQFSEISEVFEAYEQSIHCHHCLSHMMNRRSLTHLKNHCPHLRKNANNDALSCTVTRKKLHIAGVECITACCTAGACCTTGPDLEIECIHTSTGYTLFVFGIHTGYTL